MYKLCVHIPITVSLLLPHLVDKETEVEAVEIPG